MEFLPIPLPVWLPAAATILILLATVYHFIRERIPPDLTGLLALLALLVAGILTPEEAFSGFSHPATVSVAAVIVLSAGLQRTGALTWAARNLLGPLGRYEWLMNLVIMVVIAVLSAFVNNTAAVAVFIPVVLEVSRRTGFAPSRMLMPMAFAATLGGMCTLIGTSTNLVAHSVARYQGLEGFSMFELGQVGLPVAVIGLAFMLVAGRWLLPNNPPGLEALPDRAGPYLAELVILPQARWVSREVSAERLGRDFDLELVEVVRQGERVPLAGEGEDVARFEVGDRLRVLGALRQVLSLATQKGMQMHRPSTWKRQAVLAESVEPQAEAQIAGAEAAADEGQTAPAVPEAPNGGLPLAEFVILPGSPLIGRTLKQARFAERYDAVVLALHRPGARLSARPNATPIRPGDVIVTEGSFHALTALGHSKGFLLIGSLERAEQRPEKLWIAMITLVGVVVAVTLHLLPIVTAASAGCAVLMLTGCLTPREAYQAIDWRVIFLLAGTLALATALEKTGLTAVLASSLSGLVHITGPVVVMIVFFVAASLISEAMSNSGTVALLAPIAVSSAAQMGMNPMALLVAVTLGGSSAFATPIGYQTSLMVYGPGGYRFMDYIRFGLPLNILVGIVALYLIPKFWPLMMP